MAQATATQWEINKFIPATRSGQKAVTTAGTEVALGSGAIHGPLAVKALAGNGGLVFVGYVSDGTVSSATGYQLTAKEEVVFEHVNDLADILVDAAVNGEGVCWLALIA